MAVTEAQKRAQKKYDAKNREKVNLQIAFRSAKSFVKKSEDLDKLEDLKSMIEEKIKILKK
ncbi:hypothetical protein [Pseudostreptobacillus hongkongensis]|uniref:hypothetical protein n=1 Tax=Pseudostreptobacillus hongkongensis TaxID=1162717 RepID=UPI0008361549|nr:hypothetical protein [Pseudostreptobacillus hongkongensis]